MEAILSVRLYSANICGMNSSRLQKAADLNEALLALIFECIIALRWQSLPLCLDVLRGVS